MIMKLRVLLEMDIPCFEIDAEQPDLFMMEIAEEA